MRRTNSILFASILAAQFLVPIGPLTCLLDGNHPCCAKKTHLQSNRGDEECEASPLCRWTKSDPPPLTSSFSAVPFATISNPPLSSSDGGAPTDLDVSGDPPGSHGPPTEIYLQNHTFLI